MRKTIFTLLYEIQKNIIKILTQIQLNKRVCIVWREKEFETPETEHVAASVAIAISYMYMHCMYMAINMLEPITELNGMEYYENVSISSRIQYVSFRLHGRVIGKTIK